MCGEQTRYKKTMEINKKNVRKEVRCRQKWQVESQSRSEEQNIAPKGRKIGDYYSALNPSNNAPARPHGEGVGGEVSPLKIGVRGYEVMKLSM